MQIHIKRVYDAPSCADGLRVLVDRLWPRGLRREDAAAAVWSTDLAPSGELRRWFGHDEKRFDEFARRYKRELRAKTAELDALIASAAGRTITLLYAAKNTRCNNAVVLRACLLRRLQGAG